MPRLPAAKPVKVEPLLPFWTMADGETVRLYQGHVLDVLRKMPAKSVQCVVTSPPYWGLRSYLDNLHAAKSLELGSESSPDCLGWARGENCAERDWATGCHVCRIVLVFREVRRVLRDDGTCWLNYGDSYSQYNGNRGNSTGALEVQRNSEHQKFPGGYGISAPGLKSGNLVGVPWRIALALQADGWVIRQDIIWHKSAPMPESVRNRCTKAHEYVFLLTKGMGYFCDMEAIKEEAGQPLGAAKRTGNGKMDIQYPDPSGTSTLGTNQGAPLANKRSVWTVPSPGYAGAHFAVFPPKLIEPMILAGTSARGACRDCGAPWRRVVVKGDPVGGRQHGRRGGLENPYNAVDQDGLAAGGAGANWPVRTVGWEPTCTCFGDFVTREVEAPRAGAIGLPDQPGNPRANPLAGVPKGWAVGSPNDSATFHNTEEGREAVDAEGLSRTIRTKVREFVCGQCGTVWPSAGFEGGGVTSVEHGGTKGSENNRNDDGRTSEAEDTGTTVERPDPCNCLRGTTVPCVVLDPFIGSGTTAAVCLELGNRRCWGIDLSEKYLRNNAVPRVEGILLSRPSLRWLAGRTAERVEVGDTAVMLGEPEGERGDSAPGTKSVETR